MTPPSPVQIVRDDLLELEKQLTSSCLHNDVGDAKMLLAVPDLDVNCRHGSNRSTPLMVAAALGRHEVARLLLARPDVEVNWCAKWREAAIHWACDGQVSQNFVDEPASEESRCLVLKQLLAARDIQVSLPPPYRAHN